MSTSQFLPVPATETARPDPSFEATSPVERLPLSSPTPAPGPEPLRLVFPTPGAAPVSAWRPPLYPVPWAITPDDHFLFTRPIAADEVNWPQADYRYGGVFFENSVHTGVDITAQEGTPTLAAGPGKVAWAGYGLYSLDPEDLEDPYGLAVAIKHDFGYQGETLYTVYGHLSRVDVVKGQKVQAGELIGLTGETGFTTGPHLHFEVRVGKNNYFGSRNPELWLAPPQGWGVLAGRVMNTAGGLQPDAKFEVRSKTTGQSWEAKSYGDGSVNPDPIYRENLVIGDLPAGDYTILTPYAGALLNWDIQIKPGMVSYFTFQGKNGYKTGLPPAPGVSFTPPEEIFPTP
jgi:murein DD-endopeptidase MepM/ murein hydrolase activator NlpD